MTAAAVQARARRATTSSTTTRPPTWSSSPPTGGSTSRAARSARYLVRHWERVSLVDGESLVYWLRKLVFRGAWLDHRVKEGLLEVAWDERDRRVRLPRPARRPRAARARARAVLARAPVPALSARRSGDPGLDAQVRDGSAMRPYARRTEPRHWLQREQPLAALATRGRHADRGRSIRGLRHAAPILHGTMTASASGRVDLDAPCEPIATHGTTPLARLGSRAERRRASKRRLVARASSATASPRADLAEPSASVLGIARGSRSGGAGRSTGSSSARRESYELRATPLRTGCAQRAAGSADDARGRAP